MRLEPLISHTGILMTFYLSIILDLQNFFHWYILQSWKLKRPPRNSDSYEYKNKSLEEGHNSYPLVCGRPAETMSLQRRQICYRWGTPAYWLLVPIYTKNLLDLHCVPLLGLIFNYIYNSRKVLATPLYLEVSVPCLEGERSCIVWLVDIDFVSSSLKIYVIIRPGSA
jgi:hypothetical protein